MEQKQMLFQLSEKISYSKAGEFPETATIQINAPSMIVFDQASELSQMVMASMIDASKNIQGDKKVEDIDPDDAVIDAEAVKALLMSARNVKMSDVRKCFDALVLKSATFDGEVKITETTLSKMSMPDYTRMVCEYIANFIIPSLV